MTSQLRGQRVSGHGLVHQLPIRQFQDRHLGHAENFGRRFGLGDPRFERSAGRRLAVGQMHHAHLVTLLDQGRDGAAATDLQIIRVGSRKDDVQLLIAHGPLFTRPFSSSPRSTRPARRCSHYRRFGPPRRRGKIVDTLLKFKRVRL